MYNNQRSYLKYLLSSGFFISLLPSLQCVQAQILEEVIVTAQKREQSIQEVPIAISAVTRDQLEHYNLSSSNGLAKVIPNMVINGPFPDSNPKIQIRGVGTDNFTQNFQGAVGLHFDGVYIGSPTGSTLQLFDLERVEVLRGPQGTLYGRNTTAGTVNVIPARPGDDFSANGRFSVGNMDGYEADFALDIPVSDAVHTRIAGSWKTRDGTTFNRISGKDVNDADAKSGRVTLEFTPSDNFTARVVFDALFNRSDGAQYQHINGVVPTATGGADFLGYEDTDGDIYAGDYNTAGVEDVDHYGVTAYLNWDLGWADITSITGYRDVDKFTVENPDANPFTLFEASWDSKFDQVSQELRLQSKTDGRLDWTTGLYYYTDDLDADNFAFSVFLPGPFNFTNKQEVTAYALFAQLEYQITDRLKATGGIRWSYEKHKFDYSMVARATQTGPVLFPLIPLTQQEENWDAFTGRIGLDYRLTDDALVFFNYDRGFKSGGYDGLAFDAQELAPFDPEFVNSYQIGVKSTLWDGHADINLTGFFYDFEDLQIETLVQRGAGLVPTTAIDNAGAAENYGLELEVFLHPNDNLNISFAVGWLDSEITEFVSLGQDLSGNRLVSSPEWTANGLAQYSLPLTNGSSLVAGVDFSFTDDLLFDVDEAEGSRYVGNSNFQVNARLSYVFPNERYKISLWGKNLNDDEYVAYGFSNISFGHDAAIYNVPRQYGIEFSAHYD